MKTRHALLLAVVGCGACGDRTQFTPDPNARPRGQIPAATAPANAPAKAQPQAYEPPSQPTPFPTAAPAAAAAQTAKPEAEPAAEQPEKKRDLGAELQSAIGSPIDCLKPRAGENSPSELTVDLEAYFLETGAMSRGYVRGSQLAPDELDCIRKRLETIRLTAPVEQAPRTVHTTISFRLRTPDGQ